MSKAFGERLRELRLSQGFTQRQLAERAGIDFTYLSKIENDRPGYRPSEDVIRTLAKILGADAEELILLAEKVSAEVQRRLATNPKARALLRVSGELSDQDWDRIIEALQKRKRKRS